GDGSRGARRGEGGRRDRDRGDQGDQEDGGDRARDVPEAARPGAGRGQRRGAAARDRQGRRGARTGPGEAGHDHAAHEVQGAGVHPDEGRGGPAYTVLQGLPAAVLLPDDGRDGQRGAAGRDGDGDAGRQHRDGGDADHADRDGQGAALRDPR